MTEPKHFSLVKPTVNTPFHIDFAWWKQYDNNWRVYLHSCLCAEHKAAFSTFEVDTLIDWIDLDTAEVRSVDGLQHILIVHCARQPDFVSETTPLVDGAFRTLLANNNEPMTPLELAERIHKSPEMILRTLASPQVYKGMRPVPRHSSS